MKISMNVQDIQLLEKMNSLLFNRNHLYIYRVRYIKKTKTFILKFILEVLAREPQIQ